AEEVQYNIEILIRRLYGRHIAPEAKHVKRAVENVEKKKYDKDLKELIAMKPDKLKKIYNEREIEPDMADEFWEPKDKKYISVD
ncbi:4Fe-4S ferredoxin, partial [bacterium]|nr:4Fe-4S ferredoxin [bacterium]